MKRNVQEERDGIKVLLEGKTGKVMKGKKLLEVVEFEEGDNLLEAMDTLKKEHLLEGYDPTSVEYLPVKSDQLGVDEYGNPHFIRLIDKSESDDAWLVQIADKRPGYGTGFLCGVEFDIKDSAVSFFDKIVSGKSRYFRNYRTLVKEGSSAPYYGRGISKYIPSEWDK